MKSVKDERVSAVDRKAVRATLILIPLLGLQYMLFPMRPQEGSTLDDVYLITVAIVTSLQVRCAAWSFGAATGLSTNVHGDAKYT